MTSKCSLALLNPVPDYLTAERLDMYRLLCGNTECQAPIPAVITKRARADKLYQLGDGRTSGTRASAE